MFPYRFPYGRFQRGDHYLSHCFYWWTAGHRTSGLSIYFQSNFISQFLQMPPHVPPQRGGCYRTPLDIKYDPVNDSIDALNIAQAISGCPWIPADCFRCSTCALTNVLPRLTLDLVPRHSKYGYHQTLFQRPGSPSKVSARPARLGRRNGVRRRINRARSAAATEAGVSSHAH